MFKKFNELDESMINFSDLSYNNSINLEKYRFYSYRQINLKQKFFLLWEISVCYAIQLLIKMFDFSHITELHSDESRIIKFIYISCNPIIYVLRNAIAAFVF